MVVAEMAEAEIELKFRRAAPYPLVEQVAVVD
jgi:hypothetical protein